MQQTVRDVAPRSTEPLDGRSAITVLHVTAPGAVGGLESVVLALSAGHRRMGHHIHVAAVVEAEEIQATFTRALRAVDVDVHTAIIPARAYGREREFAAQICRMIQPDVVHTHGYRSDVVDAGAARSLGIPTVSTVHGFTHSGGVGRLYEWLQRRSFRRFDAVVAVAQSQVDQLVRAGVPRDRIHVIRNAIAQPTVKKPRDEVRRELGVRHDSFHIGWVGRLSREKGADVFIEALAYLADLPIDVSIIGHGREREALAAMAARKGVASRIRWHGIVPDADLLFGGFDVFVLSSRTEGTPIVLLEAMLAGVPIVATRVGGVPDVVSEAEAILVPADDPSGLAAAIRKVHSTPGESAIRGAAARERVTREFAIAPWLAKYEALYHALRSRRLLTRA